MRCFLCFGSKVEEMNTDSHPTSSDKVKVKSSSKSTLERFTFRELAAATNNFRPESIIGDGGYGRVYKGMLKNTGQVVAVKQLDKDGLQGNREFLDEVLMPSLLHHSNLVNLIGYCADGDQRLIVYEFMPLGSLEDHLHDLQPDKEPLDWKTCMKIAAGAAKGLEYLHDKANPPVIYRDFKSSNILLGEGFHSKLSNFGLVKLGPVEDMSHLFTGVMGTFGYCAPEYALTGQLTMKSNVYSFGVVLLELITGRKALDSTQPQGQQSLVTWARPLLSDRRNFAKLADPRLQGQSRRGGLYQALGIAAMCIQEHAAARPLIGDVVAVLSYLASQAYDSSSAPGYGYRLNGERDEKNNRGSGRFLRNDIGRESDKVKSSSNFIVMKKEKAYIKKQPYDQSLPQTFTYRELAAATNNFMPKSIIGEGGYGRVYKGKLKNMGQVVAVKQLDKYGLQGNEEFLAEVLISCGLHHSNLVNLIGYCADDGQRLIVSEFMPLRSLEHHLHDLPPDKEPLDWKTRMNIASGAAKGLEYLHDKANPPIIYRDFKSSNILLGEGFHPKLSDFGLAKLGPVGDMSFFSEQVAGTYGYWAPDYAKTGRLTVQSDVYSFGVVLLELITGRKAFDSTRPQGQQNLVTWARPLFVDQKKFATFADPRLQGQYPMRGLYQAVAVASMCIQKEGAARPLIRNVVAALSNLANHAYELSSAPGHGYRLCEDRGDEITSTKMAFHGTSKAIATEAWSELVHSVLSWTPPSDMSMEYYYTLPEDNLNRLDVYKYKLGAENIEARIRSGLHSQVVQANQHEYHQGIEYIQDCIRSTNDHHMVKANEREDEQAIEYVRDRMRSTNDHYVVEVNEGQNQQGIEDIQACMRSANRYDVVQVDELGNLRVIEPAQHSTGSTLFFEPNPAKNEDHQSIDNIREFVRSQVLPKGLPEPETGSQPRISYETVKKMSTLFVDLFAFIENYNMHGVEKPTLRFQVLELIKLLHHFGIDTIRSGVEEELEYVNQRNDGIEKLAARLYKKALEVMLRICDTGSCQSTIYEIIGKAVRDQVLYEW